MTGPASTLPDGRILCVFGASGRTGQQVVQQASARGWHTRAFCRSLRASAEAGGKSAIVGDLHRMEDVAAAVRGVEAVVCAYGPRAPYRDRFCGEAARVLVAAMEEVGVRRVVCVTGAMVGDYPNRSFLMQRMVDTLRRRAPEALLDREEQEATLQACGLDWTLVKPPRLTNAPLRRRYRVGTTLPVGLFSRIGRADLAHVLLDLVENEAFVREVVFVRQ